MEEPRAETEPSFFVAVLLYESSSEALGYEPMFEESFVLIKAASLMEAREKALIHGGQQEVSYQNENQETITWRLRQLIDVNAILDEELDDGSDLYARHFRNYEAYCLFESLA